MAEAGEDRPQYELRWAGVDDVPAVVAFLREVYEAVFVPLAGPAARAESAEEMRDRWHAALERDGMRALVVSRLDEIVGVSLFRGAIDDDLDEHLVARIHAFHIHPSCWRQGIGSALMAETLAELRALDFAAAVLWSLALNDRANAFYEALGWRRDGAEDDWRGIPSVRYRVEL